MDRGRRGVHRQRDHVVDHRPGGGGRAGEQLVAGEDVTKLASMAKLKAGRLGREATDACLQFWGGMGFMNETPVSRAYRDFRLTSIGGGADEVMLMVLCKMMGILPGMKKGNAT